VRIEPVREAAVVCWHHGKVFVQRRPPGERWAGLWDFLRFGLEARDEKTSGRELARKVLQHSGLAIDKPRKIATLKHGVTRFRITLDCYQARARGVMSTLPAGQWQWLEPAALVQLPLNVTGRKLSRMLAERPRVRDA
jgi:A/G-specific adenine glycosylase